jgi:hypothetical protein
VRPDYSHGRSAKYTGNVNKPGFREYFFFNRGDYWLYYFSSRGGLWPPFYRRGRLAGTSRLLSRLRHDFLNGGGWTAAPLTRSAHRVPVVFFPQIHRVGRWNLLRFNCKHVILQNKNSATLSRNSPLGKWLLSPSAFWRRAFVPHCAAVSAAQGD